MMQVTDDRYANVAEMRAAYADRRRRLMSVKTPAPKPRPLPKPVKPIVSKNRPMWKRMTITFSAHVVAWQMHMAKQCSTPVPAYIHERSEALGFTYDQIVSASRNAKIVAARHLIMWEVWMKFALSYPQIGRMFGGRDHSSCQHAIKKVAEQRGQG
jgi:chromosomal replication initiation ATPase DnaA